MSNKLQPRNPPYPDDIALILSKYPQQDGYLLALFRTFANSRRFLEKGMPNLLDKESPLLLREREIVVLRTTANRNCEYEWGVHVAIFAKHACFAEDQVRATRLGRWDDDAWPAREKALLRVVDDLCAEGIVTDEAMPAFAEHWSVEEQLEIIALVGAYSTASFVANTARLALEPFGARFPGSLRD
ncbi:MAG: carboxymuconolactone decarboxylase family protein [Alphaproteobacteria bacterium]|nr:carboxymuconolactone decarboxylase family protein [Alphaproteobacteria bacterium]